MQVCVSGVFKKNYHGCVYAIIFNDKSKTRSTSQVMGKGKGKGKGEAKGRNYANVEAKGKAPAPQNNGPNFHKMAREGNLDELKTATTEDLLRSDKFKRLPIHMACYEGQTEVVKYLLEKCPEAFFAEATDGFLPIHFASQQGKLETMKVLIRHAGNDAGGVKKLLQRTVKNKRTPLHLALWKKHLEAADFLVEKGADVTTRTSQDKLAVDFLDEPDKKVFLDMVENHAAKREKKRQASHVTSEESLQKKHMPEAEIADGKTSIIEETKAESPTKEVKSAISLADVLSAA